MATPPVNYFIAKCVSLESLQRCITSGDWACRDRTYPPHPRNLLAKAHKEGEVILIFSVNSQHGWHGYCRSRFDTCLNNTLDEIQPSSNKDFCREEINQSNTSIHKNNSLFDSESSQCYSNCWYHFPVEWLQHLQDISQYCCLPFDRTQHLRLLDGSPVNQTRNWQQIPQAVGRELCSLINSYHEELLLKRQREEEEKLTQHKEPFFKDEEKVLEFHKEVHGKGWDLVIQKINRELGKVHLACPFGSQRYNLNLPDSDNDIFIVYQAETRDILGLNPPKQTIKNSDQELVDYTVLEIQRYCELLVAGDPRCVETLYLENDEVLAVASDEWKSLRSFRHCFLTRQCLEKYMREAEGSNGLKQLLKWRSSNKDVEQLPPKISKLGYIVLRLMDSARYLVTNNHLNVFRATGSKEQLLLLDIKQGRHTFTQMIELINRYQEDIEKNKENVQADIQEMKEKIESWLLDLRVQDLSLHPHKSHFS